MVELTYTKCYLEHLRHIEVMPGKEAEKALLLTDEYGHAIEAGFSLCAWLGNTPVAAAGIVPIYPGRGLAWAMLGAKSGKYMRQITRKVRHALDLAPDKRIEMYVEKDFEIGHRWAKMLGFEVEAPVMRKHGIFGQDETLYARIK
jgi:hypothetical protein